MKHIFILLISLLCLTSKGQVDTTMYKLSHVKDKETILTETELRADGVEVAKKIRLDKAKAVARIEEIDRELENIRMLDEQYEIMLQQLRDERRKNKRTESQLNILKDRLTRILDQL